MNAPDDVKRLVERFDQNLEAYKSGKYNETQVRREFIDPFFEALGWDMYNRQGYAEAYKEVIHEDSIKVDESTRAPDYCFRIGGARKFFVEAKKPSIDLKAAVHPAYQLRRYAWSAKLPLSVLSDFEEFSAYDCRVKPAHTDSASTARIKYISYTDYIEQWEEIYGVFSKDAVLKGAFDQYADTTVKKKGTTGVDDAFLKEIESWRDVLARTIAIRNPTLSVRELNTAVQRTIDRIIFLRICEDRGIEPYGQLMTIQNGANVYPRMLELFYKADNRYDSGIFHFGHEKDESEEPDLITTAIAIDDKPLKDIIKGLYYPESPYEFSVLPADILGQVYEQFLGKVIRLTAGHRAVVEEKPEVKKAGGVFYTPTYIVDYIVKNTLDKLLEGKKIEDARGGKGTPSPAPLRVLDPACGSGSFLICAYQHLLDWYRECYIESGADKHAKGSNAALYEAQGGWRLTTQEKKRILLDHIYGVDIDPQAVEVTKLSLLLKVLENESEQTINSQLSLFKERALPDLGANIKCGNSLIGPDFYEDTQLTLMDDEERMRVNVFNWEWEFSFLKLTDGFDVVIGNPPYVRQEGLGAYKDYFSRHYKTYHGVADLYVYFIERAVTLLRKGGYFSYIVANKWMRANYGEPLRVWLKSQNIEEIIDFGDLPVFQKATTYPCIIRLHKGGDVNEPLNVTQVATLDFADLKEYVQSNRYHVKVPMLDDKGWSLANEAAHNLIETIKAAGVPLGEYVNGKIYRGVLTGLNEAFVIDAETRERLIKEDPKSEELIKPFLVGKDIKRYETPVATRYLIFTRRGIKIKDYPAIENHLCQFKERLIPRPKNWKGSEWAGRKPGSYKWYEVQDTIDYYKEFEKPKIIYPDISNKVNFTFDHDNSFYCVNTIYLIPVDDLYLLGILNSKLMDFVCRKMFSTFRGGYLRFFGQFLEPLPICVINENNIDKKEYLNRIVKRVDAMISLNKQITHTKDGHEKNVIQRQIDATDNSIDSLVYELYGLTEEEIRIVEGE